MAYRVGSANAQDERLLLGNSKEQDWYLLSSQKTSWQYFDIYYSRNYSTCSFQTCEGGTGCARSGGVLS